MGHKTWSQAYFCGSCEAWRICFLQVFPKQQWERYFLGLRKKVLSWFTLWMKVRVTVWIPLKMKIETRIGCFIWEVIPESRSEGMWKLEREKFNIRGWYQGCCRKQWLDFSGTSWNTYVSKISSHRIEVRDIYQPFSFPLGLRAVPETARTLLAHRPNKLLWHQKRPFGRTQKDEWQVLTWGTVTLKVV